jgi:hypothetical protein
MSIRGLQTSPGFQDGPLRPQLQIRPQLRSNINNLPPNNRLLSNLLQLGDAARNHTGRHAES